MESSRPEYTAELLRHFADLRDGTHGDARSRRAKERLFTAAVALLDPPYRSGLAVPALAALAAAGWLTPDALVVIEVAAREDVPPTAGFTLLGERIYGAARLVFLRREGAPTGDQR